MAEEHHIANLDPSAFFTLHDYDSSGQWSPDEIRRTYGLDDESAKDVPQEKKTSVVQEVIGMFDEDGDGVISREEWMDGWVKNGKRLPDFGVGCHNRYNKHWARASRWVKTIGRSFLNLNCLDAFTLRMSTGHTGTRAESFSAIAMKKVMKSMLILDSNVRLDPDIMAMTSMSTKSIISRSFMMRVGRSFLTLLCYRLLTGSTIDRYERRRPHAS